MLKYTRSSALLTVLSLVWQLASVDSLEVDITNASCQVYLADYVERIDIKVVPFKGHNAVDATYVFKKPPGNVMAHFTLYLGKDNKQMKLMELEFDGCKLLENPHHDNSLVDSVLKDLRKSSDFPTKCPLEVNKEYKMENFVVHLDHLPPMMPDVQFSSVTTIMTEQKEKIFDINLKGYTKK